MDKIGFTRWPRENMLTYTLVALTYMIMQILVKAGGVSASLQGQLVPICSYIVMAISLNLTVGILGELSLGHAGFMSVGAFAGVIAGFCLQNLILFEPLRLAASMAIGALFAGVAGFLIGIPVLRLKGDYIAIVTLAFGEIIKNLITCLYVGVDRGGLHVRFLGNAAGLNLQDGGTVVVNGPIGLAGIPKLSSFTGGFVLVLVTLFIVLNLINSRSGRAIMALRDNRIAAESIGIPVTKYKLMAFIMSAALAGAAGTLYAMNFSTIVATKFNFSTSILVLVFVVLGGLGNIWGSIIAAALLTILPEMLRQFSEYRMLSYAVLLILVMLATNNITLRTSFFRLKNKLWSRRRRRGRAGGSGA